MIPAVEKYLIENWSKLKGYQKPDKLLFIKFEERRIRAAEVAIITVLIKGKYGSEEKPLFILRFPRYPDNREANRSLEKENKNLSLVQEKLKGSNLAQTVPEALIYDTVLGSRFLIISFLSGRDSVSSLDLANMMKSYVELFAKSFAWREEFDKAWGGVEKVVDEELIQTFAVGEIELYKKTFPKSAGRFEQYLNRIIECSKKHMGEKITILPQHVDFHASNIFLQEGRVSGVIDWEDFEEKGLPCFDLFHYIKTLIEAFYDTAARQGDLNFIVSLSEDQNWLQAVRSLAEQYSKSAGTGPALWDVLIPLFLIKSQNIAGSPGKLALHIAKRNELLLQLMPFSLEELIYYMSSFAYGDIYKKAAAEGKQEIVAVCKQKVRALQQRAQGKQ